MLPNARAIIMERLNKDSFCFPLLRRLVSLLLAGCLVAQTAAAEPAIRSISASEKLHAASPVPWLSGSPLPAFETQALAFAGISVRLPHHHNIAGEVRNIASASLLRNSDDPADSLTPVFGAAALIFGLASGRTWLAALGGSILLPFILRTAASERNCGIAEPAVQKTTPDLVSIMRWLQRCPSRHAFAFYELLNYVDANHRARELDVTSERILGSRLLDIGLETEMDFSRWGTGEEFLSSSNLVFILRLCGIPIIGLDRDVEDDISSGYIKGVVQDMNMFGNDTFETAVSINLFHSDYFKDSYKAAAEELRRVLVNNGIFLADTITANPRFVTAFKETGFEIVELAQPGDRVNSRYLLINRKPHTAPESVKGMTLFWDRFAKLPVSLRAFLAGICEPVWYRLIYPLTHPRVLGQPGKMTRKFVEDHGPGQTRWEKILRTVLSMAEQTAWATGLLHYSAAALANPHGSFITLTALVIGKALLCAIAVHLAWNVPQAILDEIYEGFKPVYGMAKKGGGKSKAPSLNISSNLAKQLQIWAADLTSDEEHLSALKDFGETFRTVAGNVDRIRTELQNPGPLGLEPALQPSMIDFFNRVVKGLPAGSLQSEIGFPNGGVLTGYLADRLFPGELEKWRQETEEKRRLKEDAEKRQEEEEAQLHKPLSDDDSIPLRCLTRYSPVGAAIGLLNTLFYAMLGRKALRKETGFRTPVSGDDLLSKATADEFYDHLLDLERRGISLPETLTVYEFGVGDGRSASDFLDRIIERDKDHPGHEYYPRMRYVLGDYSERMLNNARSSGRLQPHKLVTQFVRLKAEEALPFKPRSALLVRSYELLDDLSGVRQIAATEGHLLEAGIRLALQPPGSCSSSRDPVLAMDEGLIEELPSSLKGLGWMTPELLQKVPWESHYFPLDLFASPFAEHRAWLENLARTRRDLEIPLNMGAFRHLLLAVELLNPEHEGYLQTFDYGYHSTPANGYRHLIRIIKGQPTSQVNFPFLVQGIARRLPHTGVILEREGEYLSRKMNDHLIEQHQVDEWLFDSGNVEIILPFVEGLYQRAARDVLTESFQNKFGYISLLDVTTRFIEAGIPEIQFNKLLSRIVKMVKNHRSPRMYLKIQLELPADSQRLGAAA
jgi:SAM-dependent methyltransferase